MANTYSGSVMRVDTTANFAQPMHICGIKYIGSTSGSIIIESNGTDSNIRLWEESGSSNVYNQVDIVDNVGVRVEVSNSAVAYLYLK